MRIYPNIGSPPALFIPLYYILSVRFLQGHRKNFPFDRIAHLYKQHINRYKRPKSRAGKIPARGRKIYQLFDWLHETAYGIETAEGLLHIMRIRYCPDTVGIKSTISTLL